MSTRFVRLEFLEKTLPLPKLVDIIVSSVAQTLEKWDSHVGLQFFCLEGMLGEDT